MTDQELRALAKNATAGPWVVMPDGPWLSKTGKTLWFINPPTESGDDSIANDLYEDDARYVAAVSPDVVIGLLDRLAKLEAVVKAAEKALAFSVRYGGMSSDLLQRIADSLANEDAESAHLILKARTALAALDEEAGE